MTKDLIDPSVFEDLQDAMGAEFAAELLAAFLDDAVNMFTELDSAVQTGDADTYRRVSHSLKSNAQTFGALALTDQARAMELSDTIDHAAATALRITYEATAQALEGLADD